MRTVSLFKRPLAGTVALVGMTVSLLAPGAARADNLLGAGDPGGASNGINAPADPEPGSGSGSGTPQSLAVGGGGALVAAPASLLFWYYDQDGPGVMKFIPAGGNQFTVKLWQNGAFYQGNGAQYPRGGGVYEAQFYLHDVFYDIFGFDGLIYDHATYGWGYYQQGFYQFPWYINRIWGRAVPFSVTASGTPVPSGGGGSNGGGRRLQWWRWL